LHTPRTTDSAAVASLDDEMRVVVSVCDQVRTLTEGESLLIGRDENRCDLCVGGPSVGPEDRGVSRQAVTVTYASGRVWVTNESSTQAVRVRRNKGPDHLLSYKGDVVSVQDSFLELLLEGHVYTYTITIHAPEAERPPDWDDECSSVPPTDFLLPLNPRERRLVAALCAPMVSRSASNNRSATYNEMGALLGVQPHTARNELDTLRSRLADLGFPGLLGAYGKESLAAYALRSLSVTAGDVEGLHQEGGE
jgi:hypothetical protein